MKGRLFATKRRHERELLKCKNVIAVGTGPKFRAGKPTGEMAVVVTVDHKVMPTGLADADLIPSRIDDELTDVVDAGGPFKIPLPTGLLSRAIRPLDFYTARYRPAPAAVSIGHYRITAGSLGCFVRLKEQPPGEPPPPPEPPAQCHIASGVAALLNVGAAIVGSRSRLSAYRVPRKYRIDAAGDLYVLSNNHVLANQNDAEIGDIILQPGVYDDGVTGRDDYAALTDFLPLVDDGDNPADCAIAKVIRLEDALDQIAPDNNNMIIGVGKAGLADPVRKWGRSTGLRSSVILQEDVTTRVQYDEAGERVLTFVGQLITGPLSAPGDSGSAVLDYNNNIVGLLFAGSDALTIVNPIDVVFSALGITR